MCLKLTQVVDSLNRDVNYETYNEELDYCDCVDYGHTIPVDPNELVIMQLNVSGLYSKIDQIKSLLNVITSNRKPEIETDTIEHCIVELKLKNENMLMCGGYRVLGQNPGKFVNEYDELICHMNKNGLPVIIGLDHNLDLLKQKNHNPTL